MTDTIADFLTRIRNAYKAGHLEVVIPYSNFKANLANLLVKEGFIAATEVVGTTKRLLKLTLRYSVDGSPAVTNLKRVSTPGQRLYSSFNQIPRIKSGFGVTIVSTSKGLLTDRQARKDKIGGEVVCQVW
jgi:small subunit ribosomal protein S8